MRCVYCVAWFFVPALACVGCAPSSDVEDRAIRAEQDKAKLERQVADLRVEIATVREENSILISHVGELRRRANSLSQRAGDLKFIVDQQERQIAVLKEIIVELRRRLAGPAATGPTDGATKPAPPAR